MSDFWQMVYELGSTVVIMLTRTTEGNNIRKAAHPASMHTLADEILASTLAQLYTAIFVKISFVVCNVPGRVTASSYPVDICSKLCVCSTGLQ